MREWRHLKGKSVVVTAAGVDYRGVVMELGIDSLLLRAAGGHREIPWERITAIRETSGKGRARGPSALG